MVGHLKGLLGGDNVDGDAVTAFGVEEGEEVVGTATISRLPRLPSQGMSIYQRVSGF